MQLASESLTFRSLNLTEKKKFIAGLIEVIGQVRLGTKWTQRGDLYIFPTTNKQKELLIQQKCVSGYQIKCSLCKTEQEVRGVVYNVPPNNTEEELLELLSNQGILKVKRFTNIGPNNITNTLPMVSLYFNTSNLPREVIIAHEIFPVKKYIPRPSLCRKCWIFGHPEDMCSNISVCRYCASAHDPNVQCHNQSKCPTCAQPDHAAGTVACPTFASKQRVIKFAYDNNMSITEAGRIIAKTQQPTMRTPEPTHHTREETSLRSKIENLKEEINKLKIATKNQTTPEIVESRIKKVEEEVATIKTQMEPILKLESQMTLGFCSLDNRMTMLHDMLLQERADRLARQKEKREAAENLQTTTNRSAGSGTQTTLQNRKTTEASKKTNNTWT